MFAFAVQRGFGDIFDGSVYYLSIDEAHYVLASGISWSVFHFRVFKYILIHILR